MRPFELVRATSLDQAFAARTEGSLFKAGGIDLLDLMKERIASPSRLVDLLPLAELRGIEATPAGLRIGALTTLAEVAASPIVREHALCLALAAGEAATPQVRNRATVGGNLLQTPRCPYLRNAVFDPCLLRGGKGCPAKEGDHRTHAIFKTDGPCIAVQASSLAPPLVALEAKAVIRGKDGERTVPVDALPPAPGELVTSVLIPATAAKLSSGYREFGVRQSFDWALVSASVVLGRDAEGVVRHARIVVGSVAFTALRVNEAEAMLVGNKPDLELARAAGEKAVEGASPLADNAYKVPLARTLVARAVADAAGLEGRR